jgi:hypothetical protein
MGHKPLLGALSVAISVIAYGIYIWRTAKKEGIQPHPFSWLLWGFVTTVAALAQQAKGAGPGNWVTAFTAVVCFIIGALTLFKHQWRFSRFDWLSLATGVIVLLFYAFTKNPTVSAVLATTADVLGYNSTIKKGWIAPYTDSATSFALNSAKFVPALFALDAYSVATWLYPAALVVVNGGVAIMLVARRWQLVQGVS